MGVTQYFSFGVGLKRRRAVKAGDGINAAHEDRGGDDFQIVARAKGDNFLFLNEFGDTGEVGLDGGHQLVAVRVGVRNFIEDFADDLVFAIVRGEIGVVGVIGIHARVHGERELEHFGADVFHFALGVGQNLFGRDRRFHHEAELFVVERLAEAPRTGLCAFG